MSGREDDADDHRHGETQKTVDVISETANPNAKAEDDTFNNSEIKPIYTWRFWAIIASLCFTGLLVAVEGTVTSTALPSIINDLEGGKLYVWVANGYFLTCTAFQPFFGQTANVFGRRWLMISACALFTLGSGIAGGARDMPMLIAGRLVQEIGGGGIQMMIELIICDLVPLRERGNVLAVLFVAVTVGTSLGPFVGGIIIERTTWRWVFYINLPIGGIALVLLYFFLQVGYTRESTLIAKLKRIDYLGNFLFMASILSILLTLSFGGVIYPWSSFRVIVPLILGFAGLFAFYMFERTPRFCPEPTLPPQLFANRTSASAFALTFIHSFLFIWVTYFLPLYFQGVLSSSPARSGVQLLPTVLVLMPFAALSGAVLGKFGQYRPFHHIGFALMAIGLGCLSLLDSNSSTAVWVIVQAGLAAGAGLVVSTLLPAAQARLAEANTATATGTWAFLRSFGILWGISIPSAVFSNKTAKLSATRISDPSITRLLTDGKSYQYATRAFLNSLPNPRIRAEVVGVFSDSLKVVWQVAVAFVLLGFLIVFVEEQVQLRTELETEFGLKEEGKKKERKEGV